MNPKTHSGKLSTEGRRFAIIESRWNELLTAKLAAGAIDGLARLGAKEEDIEIYKVPGSFELPLTAKRVAESGRFDAVICVGVIIRGETPHFDHVAGEAAKGIAQASMSSNVPVIFGIVTADTVEQAMNRCGIKFGNKGFDAAMAAVETADLHKSISENEGGDATFPHAV